MRNDFAAFILTHGRPDRVYTYETLRRSGYTGRIYIVIDDEDRAGPEYRKVFGDQVITFSKQEIAKQFDEGDNFQTFKGVVYARNAVWELARKAGIRYFIELDDDYNSGFYIRYNSMLQYGNTPRLKFSIESVFDAMIEFVERTGASTLAMSQGRDHIGGRRGIPPKLTRKAMNSFLCDATRPFTFDGRINEDVNAYVSHGIRGAIFFTAMQIQVNQLATQSNAGGMTELYLDSGTYVKSFYSVMYCPSAVKIGQLGDPRSPHYRIHHAINWHNVAPKILRETHRKASRDEVLTKGES